MKRPRVKLLGCDGNAFKIMARCHAAAKKAKWTDSQWHSVELGMMSGDYDHLLQVAMKHFDVH